MKTALVFPPVAREAGMSLPSVLVALVILGIIAVAVSSVATNMLKTAKTVALYSEEEDLRNLIRSRMDCNATKAKVSVSPGKIVLYGRSGAPALELRDGKQRMDKWVVSVTDFNVIRGEFDISVEHPGLPGRRKLFKDLPLICK